MKIALIGYGKMGKAVERIAKNRGHEVGLVINSFAIDSSVIEKLKSCDVAIEFTQPGSVVANLNLCFEAGIPVVTGTTGWNEQLDFVRQNCKQKNASLFYSSNFSMGVNVLFRLNELLAEMMKKLPAYDVSMEEQHHIHKKDAPSGTAITLAEGIFRYSPVKKKYSIHDVCQPDELKIHVVRQDEIPGTHLVTYTSTVDQIQLSHQAFNRDGFATGAVLAAEFLRDKKGIFSMKDLLGF